MAYKKIDTSASNGLIRSLGWLGYTEQTGIETDFYLHVKKNSIAQNIAQSDITITKPSWISAPTLQNYNGYYKLKFNVSQNSTEGESGNREGDITIKHTASNKVLKYNIAQLGKPISNTSLRWTNQFGHEINSYSATIAQKKTGYLLQNLEVFVYNNDSNIKHYSITGRIRNGTSQMNLSDMFDFANSTILGGTFVRLQLKSSVNITFGSSDEYSSDDSKIVYKNGSITKSIEFTLTKKIYVSTNSTGGSTSNNGYIGGGGCCFAAGSQILITKTGKTKNIEDIRNNDKIVSYNRYTQKNYISSVDFVVIKDDVTDIAILNLQDGKTVTMNAYHPILTLDGWKSLTNYNGYSTLCEGDYIKTIDGYSKLETIIREESKEFVTMYNLGVIDNDEIEDIDVDDNFYVNGICVHNTNMPVTVYGLLSEQHNHHNYEYLRCFEDNRYLI